MPPPPSLFRLAKSPVQKRLSTLFRRDRELFWIKELGTTKPYGFNHQVKGVSTLSSPLSKEIIVYSLFKNQSRRKRSHGKRHYNKKAPQHELSMTVVDIVDMIDQPKGVSSHKDKALFDVNT